MAEFLTTNGTSYHIENIIIGAEEKLVLVSPYLQISKTFYERLKDASKRGVNISIIYGKDELKKNEKKALEELENIELYFFQNLHAKCYFNEKEMVITSMNMYEFSEKNNREMGVFITQKEDDNLFKKASNETLSIIESAQLISKPKRTNKNIISKKGNCIRCSTTIPYDVEKPYCRDCFSTWSHFENSDYKEKTCHSCGRPENTSMNKPECYSCFSKKKKKSKKVYN
ncbi:phospholipase D family protein [uncultured Tenacibaculum sp.]|uniref:phospholipase D family protein n=1 Tax=uncultured Tenacibaculum sp. TaxID=174713 RepID=UPI002602AAC5|nr:phospholipase D family protein [uncultured Tenacibaculum sp.]